MDTKGGGVLATRQRRSGMLATKTRQRGTNPFQNCPSRCTMHTKVQGILPEASDAMESLGKGRRNSNRGFRLVSDTIINIVITWTMTPLLLHLVIFEQPIHLENIKTGIAVQ